MNRIFRCKGNTKLPINVLNYIQEYFKFETFYICNMRILISAACIFLLIFSCSEDKHNFTIRVSVNGVKNETLHLARRTLDGTVQVDSAVTDKSGIYILEGYTEQPDFYIMYIRPQHYINLIINPGDDFRVRADVSGFENNYLVEGSKDSRLIQKMVSMQAKTLVKITEISTAYENGVGQPGFEKLKLHIDSTYKTIVEEHRNFSIRLIEENPHSLASLMALYQQLGKDIPVFDYKTDFGYYQRVDSNLAALYPKSEAVRDLDRKVNELKNLIHLEKGSQAPVIALPDIQGKTQSLREYRGKYVLLVFWASWSSQSCEAVKKIIPVYDEFKDKGLDLYMVSLDRSGDSWKNRMTELHVAGTQVSDLKYWDSPVVDAYKINQLPVLYLLDKEGRILNKDFGPDDLKNILNEIL
jgi:peroxiredoxin